MRSGLSLSQARGYVAAAGFRPGAVGGIGVELEWLVRDPADPYRRPAAERLRRVFSTLPDPLPGGGRLSIEPGGQLELSSAVAGSLSRCVMDTGTDLALVRGAVADAGLQLEGAGLDTVRPPELVRSSPRYEALRAYHDRFGGDGRIMMCNSASVQVCVDVGDDSGGWSGHRYRWRLADSLGPVLLAAFANSPGRSGSGTRLRSLRQLHRFAMDATRTRPAYGVADPRQAWCRYALAARVAYLVRQRRYVVGDGFTFADWLRGFGPRPAGLADLRRHLRSLVPPVRPRGRYLELRMIDAQPADGWVVPLAVTVALLDDPVAADVVAAACEPLRSLRRRRDWLAAARRGLSDPRLAGAAAACFGAAIDALDRGGVAGEILAAVAGYADRYVARGRCPADDAFDPIPVSRGGLRVTG